MGTPKPTPPPPHPTHTSTLISELPAYPIERPSYEEMAIIQYIAAEQAVTKKQLIRHARQVVDRFKRNAEEKGIQIDDDPYMGEYRLLDTHILDPLVERACIDITEVGRSKEITITEDGQNTSGISTTYWMVIN